MLRFNKPSIDRKDLESVLYCMVSDHLVPGVQLKEFTSLLRKTLRLGHAAVFSSGMFSYEMLFRVLEAVPGDEVVMPSFAPARLLHAAQRAGLVPVLVDLAEGSLVPDPGCVRAAVTERTRCVILTHLFGIPHDLSPFLEPGVPLVEDLDGELSASIGGRSIGSFGRYVTTRFDDDSTITTGGGGMLASADRGLRSTLASALDGAAGVNGDYLMSDLNASLGVSQIKKLDRIRERRTAIGAFFDEAVLASSCSLVGREEEQELGYTRYVIGTGSPFPEVQRFFKKHGIPVRPALEQPLHRILDRTPGEFRNTENMCASLVSLPIYPSMKKDQVERIARGIRAVL